MTAAEFVFKVPGRTENLELIRDFVSRVARRYGFDPEQVDDISLAVDEACTNVLSHSARRERRRWRLDVRVRHQKDRLAVVVHDRNPGFPLDRGQRFDLERHLARRQPGGLGLYLIQRLMDEVHVEQLPRDRQALTMVKYRGARG